MNLKKKKKQNQKPTYQFSAESGERYDEWLEEAGKRRFDYDNNRNQFKCRTSRTDK